MRYFLDQDCSSHWYLIPFDKQDEWKVYTEIPEDDPRCWDTPAFADSIDGPSSITFTSPKSRFE
jgi:hypothetical protein